MPYAKKDFAKAAHVAPYVLWISVIAVFQILDSLTIGYPRHAIPLAYMWKSVAALLLMAVLKPWRYYCAATGNEGKGNPLRQIMLAIGAGGLVAFFWIVFETEFFYRAFPGFSIFYRKWLVMPFGSLPGYFDAAIFPRIPALHPSRAYSLEEAGIFLTLSKAAGSSFVIAAAEEFFFRGFLYRWLRPGNFLEIPLGKFDRASFWTVAVLFALEHDRWLMGLAAGIVYGILAIRTSSMRSPVIAHVTTNLLLSIYVIMTGHYGFW